jgi:hypothetical protein
MLLIVVLVPLLLQIKMFSAIAKIGWLDPGKEFFSFTRGGTILYI